MGRLALPWGADGPGFGPLVDDDDMGSCSADEGPAEAKPHLGTGAVIEVEVAGGVLRVPAEMAVARTAAVVSALKAPMIVPGQRMPIAIAVKPIDFRDGDDELIVTVQNELGLDVYSGLTVVSRSKRGDRIKLLVRDGSGLVMT